MDWLCWIGLLLCTAIIVYEDFKQRLISIWAITGFGLSCCTLYLLTHFLSEWLENSFFCLAYFTLCYLILHLFYFLKTKHFQKIIDVKIGWGDILLLLLIGSCLTPVFLIFFFTSSFIFALLFQILLQRKSREIALAGILVICYFLFVLVESISKP